MEAASLLHQEGRSTPSHHDRSKGHAKKGVAVSLERPSASSSTERRTFGSLGDSTTPQPDAPTPEPSHDQALQFVHALTQVTRSWGSTLRLVFLVVAVGATVRMLVGPIPWDQLAALLELGK